MQEKCSSNVIHKLLSENWSTTDELGRSERDIKLGMNGQKDDDKIELTELIRHNLTNRGETFPGFRCSSNNGDQPSRCECAVSLHKEINWQSSYLIFELQLRYKTEGEGRGNYYQARAS
jgi:hypothetical protein